jgi:hypothetical protein
MSNHMSWREAMLRWLPGVCADGGSSVVTWTRVCGAAADALVPISAVEVVSPADADSQCAAVLSQA